MKYVILIEPNEKITIKEHNNFHTINELVDGWFESCGCFFMFDSKWLMYCNEEFLLREDIAFNAMATILTGHAIYGNIVVMLDGINDEGECDALPMNINAAKQAKVRLEDLIKEFSETINLLHKRYDDAKPEPSFQIISFSSELSGEQ